MVIWLEYLYYTIYILTSLRFMWHTGVLAFHIDEPKQYLKRKTNKRILIQYPVRNEPYHLVFRFLMSLKTIPESERHRVTVQILDDSDTPMRRVANIEKKLYPITIEWLKREVRTGNKAGNLNYGLSVTSSSEHPFVAIYDSDHQMDGKGLIEAVEILNGTPKIACVQSRWTFDNANWSLCSLLQQQFLGVHINREQTWRSRHNIYPIFNGAGAVWNRLIVEKVVGGWPERCVCEDTDISAIMNMRGYMIHVLPSWVTKIDLVESWGELQKQANRWIKGNGQQLQYHLRDPNGWNWKKWYWISWNIAFAIAPFKYIVPIVAIYKASFGIPFNIIDQIGFIPHIFAYIASCRMYDNSFYWKGLFLYPLHYILELRILHHQIKGFWQGWFNWNKHIEFAVTKKTVE